MLKNIDPIIKELHLQELKIEYLSNPAFPKGSFSFYSNKTKSKQKGYGERELIFVNSSYIKENKYEIPLFIHVVRSLRHAYQYQQIKNNPNSIYSKLCISNYKNYIKDKQDPAYPLQYLELDAIAYSELKLTEYYNKVLNLPVWLRGSIDNQKQFISQTRI